MQNILKRIKRLAGSIPFIFLTVSICAFIVLFFFALELSTYYFYRKNFSVAMTDELINGKLQHQKYEIDNFLTHPLNMMDRFIWSIKSSDDIKKFMIILESINTMNIYPGIQLISILINDGYSLEISKKEDENDNSIPSKKIAYRCVIFNKKKDSKVFKEILFNEFGDVIDKKKFKVGQNLSDFNNRFSAFSSYSNVLNLPWFKNMEQQVEPVWTTPSAILGLNKGLFVSIAAPLTDKEKNIIGVVMAHIPFDQLVGLIKNICSEEAIKSSYLFNSNGTIIACSNPDTVYLRKHTNINRNLSIKNMNEIEADNISAVYNLYVKNGAPDKIALNSVSKNAIHGEVAYFHKLPDRLHTDWTLMSIMEKEKASSYFTYKNFFLIKIALLMLSISIIIFLIIVNFIVTPIKTISKYMLNLSVFQIKPLPVISAHLSETESMIASYHELTNKMQDFCKLVPLNIAKLFISEKKDLRLFGQKTDATVSFCDLGGFSHLLEFMPPDDILHYLSFYFDSFTEIIHQNNGLVNQYIGDAISAMWGVPNYVQNHREQACRSALNCLTALEKTVNPKLSQQGFSEAYLSFGISSGHMLAGNVGSSDHMQYTVIGENAKLSEQLQFINRFYKTRILVTYDVYCSVNQLFAFRPVDKVYVKGATLMLYELLADFSDKENQDLTPTCYFIVQTQKAWAAYASSQWLKAEKLYESILEQFPNDYLSKSMADRCKFFISFPPKVNWDGAFKLEI